jgi:hypothetical protein
VSISRKSVYGILHDIEQWTKVTATWVPGLLANFLNIKLRNAKLTFLTYRIGNIIHYHDDYEIAKVKSCVSSKFKDSTKDFFHKCEEYLT